MPIKQTVCDILAEGASWGSGGKHPSRCNPGNLKNCMLYSMLLRHLYDQIMSAMLTHLRGIKPGDDNSACNSSQSRCGGVSKLHMKLLTTVLRHRRLYQDCTTLLICWYAWEAILPDILAHTLAFSPISATEFQTSCRHDTS